MNLKMSKMNIPCHLKTLKMSTINNAKLSSQLWHLSLMLMLVFEYYSVAVNSQDSKSSSGVRYINQDNYQFLNEVSVSFFTAHIGKYLSNRLQGNT